MALVDVFVLFCFVLGSLSAFFVAFHPNILYAALALIGALLSVAGMYGALGADFLAAAQLIIYVGGILVVILFAVMMSADIYKTRFLDQARKYVVPVGASVLILAAFVKIFTAAKFATPDKPTFEPTSKAMGWALVGPYALAFQYVAIVLLFGLIGAVIVARPHIKKKDEG